MAKPNVKIYTTPTCVYCKAAKEFMKENKINFKEIDVSKNQKAAKEMIEKSGQMGVPVLDIDGKIILGFDQEAIEQAVKKGKSKK